MPGGAWWRCARRSATAALSGPIAAGRGPAFPGASTAMWAMGDGRQLVRRASTQPAAKFESGWIHPFERHITATTDSQVRNWTFGAITCSIVDMLISAAARRIVHAANAERTGWRLYFNADGREVARIYGVEAFGYSGDYRLCVRTDEGGIRFRYTLSDIQRDLDARDAADAIGWPDGWTVIVDSWQFADETGHLRTTAAEVAEIHNHVIAEEDAQTRAEDAEYAAQEHAAALAAHRGPARATFHAGA